MKWVSKGDFLAIAALLCAALLLFLLRNGRGEDGARFEIVHGGEIVHTGLLSIDREFSYSNLSFAVRDGRIAATHSNCRDQICVRTGYIGVPGQITACLPNGLVVRIVGDGGVDAVV